MLGHLSRLLVIRWGSDGDNVDILLSLKKSLKYIEVVSTKPDQRVRVRMF